MISNKTKLFFAGSLVFFIMTAIGVYLILQYVQSKGEELQRQTKEIADFEARNQSYRELEKLVTVTQNDRLELDTFILTEEKTIDFLSTIEQLAYEQGIELSTDSLKVVEGTDLFDTLIISYTIAGLKNRIGATILLLETLPYHAYISNLSLVYSTENGSQQAKGSVELTVSLINYDR